MWFCVRAVTGCCGVLWGEVRKVRMRCGQLCSGDWIHDVYAFLCVVPFVGVFCAVLQCSTKPAYLMETCRRGTRGV